MPSPTDHLDMKYRRDGNFFCAQKRSRRSEHGHARSANGSARSAREHMRFASPTKIHEGATLHHNCSATELRCTACQFSASVLLTTPRRPEATTAWPKPIDSNRFFAMSGAQKRAQHRERDFFRDQKFWFFQNYV